jgi:hypothetical protein
MYYSASAELCRCAAGENIIDKQGLLCPHGRVRHYTLEVEHTVSIGVSDPDSRRQELSKKKEKSGKISYF